jgi:hypothetical protein
MDGTDQIDRIGSYRILDVLGAWKPPDAVARYESDLTTAGFVPLGNVSAATQ